MCGGEKNAPTVCAPEKKQPRMPERYGPRRARARARAAALPLTAGADAGADRRTWSKELAELEEAAVEVTCAQSDLTLLAQMCLWAEATATLGRPVPVSRAAQQLDAHFACLWLGRADVELSELEDLSPWLAAQTRRALHAAPPELRASARRALEVLGRARGEG